MNNALARKPTPRNPYAAALVTSVIACAVLCGCSSGRSTHSAAPSAQLLASSGPVAPLHSSGGPFLTDRYGRVVLMHGVDLVYKVAPFEVVVSGKGPNVLSVPEVQKMASLGFDVVRLGIIWKGAEPGTLGMNSPQICTKGKPRASGSGQFDAAVVNAYLRRLDATISLLGRHGIYSLIDMHQDVYNQAFGGEGAPNWAVCTDGLEPHPKLNVPNWSVNYSDAGVAQAYGHFWENDVVGNLQGDYDSLWARIAAHYRGNQYVVGYDPFNEPWNQNLYNGGFDAELECFYTGRAHPGVDQAGRPVTCPPDDPAQGLIPRVEAADPTHLVFYEPNYATDSAVIPNRIGAMQFPRLVLNFHDYCFLHVPNGPEPAGFASTCGPLENSEFDSMDQDRLRDATPFQPGGPAWFLTEFGATTDASDLARVTADADAHLVGWMYWQWLHYDDPTGSHASGLWPPTAPTQAQLEVLSQTYAQAVAGTPTSMSFDPSSDEFTLGYRADPAVDQPTVVFVPVSMHYRKGYCATAVGGRIVSAAGAVHLDVRNDPGATEVSVHVVAGRCS